MKGCINAAFLCVFLLVVVGFTFWDEQVPTGFEWDDWLGRVQNLLKIGGVGLSINISLFWKGMFCGLVKFVCIAKKKC